MRACQMTLEEKDSELIPLPIPGRKRRSAARSPLMNPSILRSSLFGVAAVLCILLILRTSGAGQYRLVRLSPSSSFSDAAPSGPDPDALDDVGPPQAVELGQSSEKSETPVVNVTRDYSSFQSSSTGHPRPNTTEAHDFWKTFAGILARGKPSFPEIRRKNENGAWIFYDRHHQDSERPDNLEMSDEEFGELRDLRASAINDIRDLVDQLPYIPGTRGIITTAPPNAFAMLTTSLWMLRKTGSTLPVEIWMYDRQDYEEVPCDVVFASLNAKCMFMAEYLPDTMDHALDIVKFTYKPLAAVFSTFEEILFLDDDVFPVLNPDPIMDSEPFKSNGMVLWPDYWADTASLDLYKISDIDPVPDMKTRATTESGQFMIAKSTHGTAMMLATWYNTYGPNHWHRLATQGSPGEGDKDLWKFSALAFGLKYHQVEEPLQRLGYQCDGTQNPIASAQSHPVDDWRIQESGISRDRDVWVALGSSTHPRILFIHANLPKLDAHVLLDWTTLTDGFPTILRCDNGTGAAHRLYGPEALTVPKYGWDMEKAIWNAFMWMTCKYGSGYKIWTEPSWWRPEPRQNLCQDVQVFWDELFPGEEWEREAPTASANSIAVPWGQHAWD